MRSYLLASVTVVALSTSAMASEGSYATAGFGHVVASETTGSNQTALTVGAGHDFGYYRVEGTFRNLNSAATDTRVNANIGTVSGYVQYPVDKWTPFVGAGLGYGVFNGGGVTGARDGIVYVASAGASYDFNQNWAGVLQYDYLRSPVAVTAGSGDRGDYVANSVSVAARYKF
jgi:hypothetical protein